MWSSSSGESVFLRPFLWVSTCSVIAVLLNPTCVQCLPSEKRSKSAGDPDVVGYLTQFGYLSEPSQDANNLILDDGEALKNAIETLQRSANIPVTGKVDERTAKILRSPRCGLPDNPSSSNGLRTKRSPPKSDITWSINSQWRELPAHHSLVQRQLRKALNVWERNANIKFIEKDIGQSGSDISMRFVSGKHEDGFPFDGRGKTLAHAFHLQSSNEGIEGDVHFDKDEEWTVTEGDSRGTSLFSVAVHELGHSLGLSHVSESTSVMYPYYFQELDSNFDLSRFDRDLIQQIYGPPNRYYPRIDSPEYSTPRSSSSSPRTPSTTYPNHRRDRTTPGAGHTSPSFHPDLPRPPAPPVRPAPPRREEPPTGEPDRCNTSYDAISVIRGELFIFKGKYFWRFRQARNLNERHGPSEITRMWNSSPKDLTHVDAVYERSSDEKIVFFIGRQIYQFIGNRLDDYYPKPLTSLGLHPSVDHIDAALVWGHNKKTYLFSGRSYWALAKDENSIERDYPRDMGIWRGIGYNIDAAFKWTDDYTYFFKGKGFWKFDDRRMAVTHERRSDSAKFWMGCHSGSGPRIEFLVEGDPDSRSPKKVNDSVILQEAHKSPTPPPAPSSGVSIVVIACVAAVAVLLTVATIAVVVQRRRRKHSYQQPKWLKVNKKIIM